ncbi:MAG TPA: hypothetical protein PLD55_14470 [bacterium]|nr:hypothetical protein [bacterium]
MKISEIWSLKAENKLGISPLALILNVVNTKYISLPLFAGDENATHKDRMIYPYQKWLNHEDWVSLSGKTDLPESSFKDHIGTLPWDIFEKIKSAANGGQSDLPKGILLIEGLGDKREKFKKELRELFDAAAKEISVSTIIIKKVKKGWEAVNAVIEEILPAENIFQGIGITAFPGISFGSRGNGKSNGLSALSIGNDEISIILIVKKSEEGLRIMNITGEIGTIAINTKGSTVKCKKIGNTWIPEELVFIEKTSSITVDGRINIKISV